MPFNSDIERRNRALIAITLLTGARDNAIASMKIKHVDLAEGSVFQDAREVQTKFSRTFTMYPPSTSGCSLKIGVVCRDLPWSGFRAPEIEPFAVFELSD